MQVIKYHYGDWYRTVVKTSKILLVWIPVGWKSILQVSNRSVFNVDDDSIHYHCFQRRTLVTTFTNDLLSGQSITTTFIERNHSSRWSIRIQWMMRKSIVLIKFFVNWFLLAETKTQLDQYCQTYFAGLVRILRLTTRRGLIRAKNAGAQNGSSLVHLYIRYIRWNCSVFLSNWWYSSFSRCSLWSQCWLVSHQEKFVFLVHNSDPYLG